MTVVYFPAAEGPEPWMTKKQYADYAGFSLRYIEYRLQEGLPHRRMGGLIRIRASEADAWLERQEKRSA